MLEEPAAAAAAAAEPPDCLVVARHHWDVSYQGGSIRDAVVAGVVAELPNHLAHYSSMGFAVADIHVLGAAGQNSEVVDHP